MIITQIITKDKRKINQKMKKTIIASAIAFTAFTACNNEDNKTKTTTVTDSVAPAPSTPATYNAPAGVDPNVAASIKGIVDGYLHLKNALVKSDSKEAAAAGIEITAAVGKVDMTPMNDTQMKVWHLVMDDIKEHGEHISENAGKIDHQREHFKMLGEDVEDLVKTFGGGQHLYKTFCPMAFDGKGAAWISEIKEIRNPYYGDEMLECGEVKEELN